MDIEVPVANLPERAARSKPLTELQAVMEAGFGEEPQASIEEQADLFTVVRNAFEALPDHERMLLEACVFERASFRELEQRWHVPKTTLHRWYATAILQLRIELIEYPEIQTYLEGTNR